VIVLTDEAAGRMRIITPVGDKPLEGARVHTLIEANFHTALDARYALQNGVLWSAFIHPLGPLTQDQFLDGIGQTIMLARTYGTTYSSSGLRFGGQEQPGEVEEIKPQA